MENWTDRRNGRRVGWSREVVADLEIGGDGPATTTKPRGEGIPTKKIRTKGEGNCSK